MAATKDLAITIKARNEASRALNQVKGDVKGLSGGLDNLTRSAIKVAAAFVGFQAISREIKAAYKSVVELDTGLRQLWTRLDVGEKQMGGISKAIQDVAIQFGHAASMGVKAVDTIASSGYDAASAFRIYQTAAKAAVASGQAVDTTAAQIAQVMSTYRLAANEVDRVADLLFATKVPLGEIASIVGDIGYEAKALGVPLEELVTVLGRMHQEGADVGQLIRIFRQIQGEGKAWLIQQYGLVEGIERYAKSKGDMRQIATIMGLIRAGTGQVADATGALDAAFAKTWESFQVQTSRVREALSGVWREIVNIFIPGDPAKWADTLIEKLQQVRQWISQNSDALRYFIKMFGELAIVVGLIVGVKAALGLLSNTMFQLALLGSLVWVAWKVDLFGIREALRR
ncbi:MAG: phage tail tape measure protein [Candidatus Thermoplasmatota archaeon]|nr:phage tail tape measure protein [Candidatus Thermoplasmatota archaeon]